MTLERDKAAIFGTPSEPDGAGNPSGGSVAKSSRAPRDPKGARHDFRPIPMSELRCETAALWCWEGYLAVGHITLLCGLWKAGKTTLVAHLLRLFGSGGDLGGSVEAGRVLIVSEESAALWIRRRDSIGIGDHVHTVLRPFLQRPSQLAWESFVAELAGYVRDNDYKVVIFDTLGSVWPVMKENEAGPVQAALMPLHMITRAGAAVLLNHHPKKGDAGEGQAARGSGALPAFVDIILELRRYNATDREDTRRVLTAYSRFDETPPELVLELAEDGYRSIGSKGHATQSDRFQVIADIIGDSGGQSADDICKAWPVDCGIPKPGKRKLEADLRAGTDGGRWVRIGKGVSGDPFQYRAAAVSA